MTGASVLMIRATELELDAQFPPVPDENVGVATGPDGEQLPALVGLAIPRCGDGDLRDLHGPVAVDECGRPRFLVTILGADAPLVRFSIGPNHGAWPFNAAAGFVAVSSAGADRFTPGRHWRAAAVVFGAATAGVL